MSLCVGTAEQSEGTAIDQHHFNAQHWSTLVTQASLVALNTLNKMQVEFKCAHWNAQHNHTLFLKLPPLLPITLYNLTSELKDGVVWRIYEEQERMMQKRNMDTVPTLDEFAKHLKKEFKSGARWLQMQVIDMLKVRLVILYLRYTYHVLLIYF